MPITSKIPVVCRECGRERAMTASEIGWLAHIKGCQPRSPLENLASRQAWDAAVAWIAKPEHECRGVTFSTPRPRYILLGLGDELAEGDEFLIDTHAWFPVGELAGIVLSDDTAHLKVRRAFL